MQDEHLEIYDEVAYLYDGSLEGLLTACFESYRRHEKPSDVTPQDLFQPRLSQRIVHITTDEDIAYRVRKGLIKKGGWSAFNAVRKASCSSNIDAGTSAFTFVRYAMDEHKSKRRPFSNISHPSVAPLFEICRSVDNECEHMRQFIRFEHLSDEHDSEKSLPVDTAPSERVSQNTDREDLAKITPSRDIWFARCNPRDSVIPLIMNHFVERFNIQPFIIHDEVHEICGVYDGQTWYLVKTDAAGFNLDLPAHAEDENIMQDAWRKFYNTVSVDARYNPELRQHFMPRRLWRNITEMQDK